MSSAAKSSVKKRRSDAQPPKSEERNRIKDDTFDPEIASDIKDLMSALNQIKEKAHKDGQRKKEETISSVAAEMKSKFEELKVKIEKERQTFSRALSKSSKECENFLKTETAKFQAANENFSKEKAAHLQALQDTVSKYEEEKERLFTRFEHQRKRERSMIADQQKACEDKIAELEASLKKKKQDDKTFCILRKTLGSFLDNGSDEDFPPDD